MCASTVEFAAVLNGRMGRQDCPNAHTGPRWPGRAPMCWTRDQHTVHQDQQQPCHRYCVVCSLMGQTKSDSRRAIPLCLWADHLVLVQWWK